MSLFFLKYNQTRVLAHGSLGQAWLDGLALTSQQIKRALHDFEMAQPSLAVCCGAVPIEFLSLAKRRVIL